MELPEGFTISGYYPGVIGKVTELHAVYYHLQWGFDVSFEIQVAREAADFLENFDAKRDGFWAARAGDAFAGCIALDGRLRETLGARIRWFIVSPEYQGKGLGRFLLRKAVEFCTIEKGIRKIFLFTFRGLDSARRLYEGEGFRLVEEQEIHQWGAKIFDQEFERPSGL